MSKILTSLTAINIYNDIENIIKEYILRNEFKYIDAFIGGLKLIISQIGFGDKLEMIVDLKELQIELILNFDNSVLYIRILFYEDEDVLFIHNTDLVYVSDKDGIIKQDILSYLKNINQ